MSDNGTRHARRLLMVDDSRLILRMVRDHFEQQGYAVDDVERAEEALARLAERRPDVIVADILMPGMDGWQFYEQVKGDPATADIPFVFLSTEARLSKRLRGLRMGADDYLTKPFAVEELHARVERLLARRAGASEPPEPTESPEDGTLLAGSARHLPVSDLLQILAVHGRRGVVELTGDGRSGRIVFDGDRLTRAEAGEVAGRKALYRMLTWEDASFRVRPCRDGDEPGALDLRVSDALMDGMVAMDEWSRWSDAMPDAGMRLEVVDSGDGQPEVGPVELEIVTRCRRGLTIAEILEDCPMTDAELAQAICALVEREIVRPVV